MIKKQKLGKSGCFRLTQTTTKPDPPEAPVMEYPDLETPGGGVSGGSVGNGGSSSTVPTTYQSKPLAGSMDLSKLTDDDFNHLAFY